jgi:UDP-GlcNAc:undecaprenyl-phosphate GlcNAc-1-phosphate transferase
MTQQFLTSATLAGVAALLASVALTPIVGALARRTGIVAKPKSDRWHTKPTAMLGGVAIVIAVTGTLVGLVPMTREGRVVIAASVALFLIGLLDDFFHIKPYQKLIGQLLGAAAVVSFGLVLPWTPYPTINLLITLFWLVGITNAVNMLDNMDGLSAGVSAIAAAFLGLNFIANQQWPEAVMLAAFAGALVGFLVYNHYPASIFMGDCGSMFVGFFLASSALVSGTGGGRSRSVVAVLAVPVLVLMVPIFDTTLVTLMRKKAGRAASQGGRDHTSHRLVALGLSERRAVWMLYTFAVLSGSLAMLARHAALKVSLIAIASFTIVLTILGVYLARVRVYDEE